MSKILYVADSLGCLRRLQALAQAATGSTPRVHWFGTAPSSADLAASGLRAPDVVHAQGGTSAGAFAAATAALAAESPRALVIAGHGPAARAAALAAVEANVPIVQADAGVRSHDPLDAADRQRRAADHTASLWLCASAQQAVNCKREGFADRDVITTGSLLAAALPRREANGPRTVLLTTSGDTAAQQQTLQQTLQPIVAAAGATLARAAVVDPAHLRTATAVVTDAPELAEAAAALGIACVLVTPFCARPETVDSGHTRVAGPDASAIARALAIVLQTPPRGASPYAADAAAAAGKALTAFLARPAATAPQPNAPVKPPALPSDGDWTGRTLGFEECELAARAIRSGTLNSTKGTFVTKLEKDFAAFTGRKFAIACASGSAAVHCAINALQLQPGDEVVTTPITDMGALTCILYEGGIPVFADVDPVSINVTAATIEQQITPRTKAIVVTHLFGLPCDMQPIVDLAARRGIPIIEDMAQAFGCEEKSGRPGTRSAIASYSLQQGKHMTTGEGGVVTTDDPQLARRLFLFVNKAWGYGDPQPDHYFPALNYRLTELQGAVALAQLQKLDWVVQRRREVAAQLTAGLRDIPGLVLPGDPQGGRHSWWKYAFFVDANVVEGGAVELGKRMKERGVFCVPRYIQKPAFECQLFQDFRKSPVSSMPLEHSDRRKQPQPLFHRRDYPGAVQALERVIVLPINELYGKEHVDYVTSVIREQARVLAHV